MPHILEYNLSYVSEEKVSMLLRVVGASSVRELIKNMCNLMNALGIPDSIADVGVKPEELDIMAKDALEYKRNVANNPAPLSEDVMKELLRKALLGRSKVYGS
jgi:alcohol dehydrogenase class IV